MIIFALCLEPLLRLLEVYLSSGDVVGAFADDIGFVIQHLRCTLPKIRLIFEMFGKASGLDLNISKCIVVPLGDNDQVCEQFKEMLATVAPKWAEFKVQGWAEYLGFMLGPDSVDKQWSSVIRKAYDTTRRWANLHSGFFYNVLC